MLEALKKIQEQIDSRIIRERVLILLSMLAVIFMFWSFIIQAPFDKKIKASNTELADIYAQKATLQTQIIAATQSLLNDPDRIKKEQIVQIETDIEKLESELLGASHNLIKAEQLPLALQEVLQKTSQLTLLEVSTLPAHELQLVQPQEAADKNAKIKVDVVSTGVFQHTVELKVSGSYVQILQLLVALEKLPWKFYWQSLDYSVVHYPNAEMVLRVYTLSSEEGLFGV